ncbi:MAG TPA: segregation/condensation protein A [Candidatus Sumerlaeia bacterium]|nr:segregation/condensation protein A [Candidatus Sumerlaeia bacterium]
MTYRVKIRVFDGPFDLLLHLIKINEMDINDIPIAEITNQYLEYIQIMKDLDLDVAGEFLVMAATLINIKARSLLPSREDDSDEEEIDEILSAKELTRQLIEYRKFKELAENLRGREEQFSCMFFRTEVVPILPGLEREDEPLREDIKNLFSAFSRVLRFAEERGFHKVFEEEFSTEEKITQLLEILSRESSVDILNVFKQCRSKGEMFAYFLATLELCRLQKIRVVQSALFDSIYVSLAEEESPEVPEETGNSPAPTA